MNTHTVTIAILATVIATGCDAGFICVGAGCIDATGGDGNDDQPPPDAIVPGQSPCQRLADFTGKMLIADRPFAGVNQLPNPAIVVDDTTWLPYDKVWALTESDHVSELIPHGSWVAFSWTIPTPCGTVQEASAIGAEMHSWALFDVDGPQENAPAFPGAPETQYISLVDVEDGWALVHGKNYPINSWTECSPFGWGFVLINMAWHPIGSVASVFDGAPTTGSTKGETISSGDWRWNQIGGHCLIADAPSGADSTGG